MEFTIGDPVYQITIGVFSQLLWALMVIGGLTLYLLIRAIVRTFLGG